MGLIDDEADERLAEWLREMPTAFTAAPDTETESRHLAAITAAARDLAHQDHSEPNPALGARRWLPPAVGAKWRNTLSRNRPMIITAKLAASALAVCAVTAGLAVAGVTLPDPASDVAKAIGLPNQADDNSGNAADIEGAEDVRQNSERGSKPDTTSEGEGDDVSTESPGESHGIGESVSDETQNLRDAMREATTPGDRKDAAEKFRNSVKDYVQDPDRLPDQAQSAPETGETHSQDGSETGETHSQEGQSLGQEKAAEHRPEDPGGDRP